jgi:DnaJ family protein B protein 12
MDTGPGFVFNLGGGPGVRVHQFGGGRPRRRPGTAVPPGSEGQQNVSSAFANLLPLLFLFVLPLLSSLFSGSSTTSAGPSLVFETPRSPNTMKRVSTRIKIDYFVDPKDVHDYTPKKWRKLDEQAENQYVHVTNTRCQNERVKQRRAMEEAQGWFSVDQEAMNKARNMELKNCNKLRKLGLEVY